MAVKAFELPRWVTSNAESVAREAADYIAMTPAERLRLLDLLCRDAERLLEGRADRETVVAYRDPVSEDTRVLLARLRAGYKAARSRGV
jgi:hypothetical protein